MMVVASTQQHHGLLLYATSHPDFDPFFAQLVELVELGAAAASESCQIEQTGDYKAFLGCIFRSMKRIIDRLITCIEFS